VLATVGDLVDDIVVRLGGPIHVATDTDAVIERRHGGSAANVAVTAARITGGSRFLGQVGHDARGVMLLTELAAEGVDVSAVRRAGRTGSIVVLVDAGGERSFLTDPGSARDLDDPLPETRCPNGLTASTFCTCRCTRWSGASSRRRRAR
jgi:sugar/nucleoside kinase (ribokinase family)